MCYELNQYQAGVRREKLTLTSKQKEREEADDQAHASWP